MDGLKDVVQISTFATINALLILTSYYSHFLPQEYYNNVPDKATSFKGRALMKFRIESHRPDKYDKPEVQPFKRRIKPVKV